MSRLKSLGMLQSESSHLSDKLCPDLLKDEKKLKSELEGSR